MATKVMEKTTVKGYMPKTVREQLFYMYGNIMGLEADESGNVSVNINWIVDNFDKALELADNEKLPTITYRDYRNEELPKGTFVSSTSSTDYLVKRVGVVDYPQTTAESVKL